MTLLRNQAWLLLFTLPLLGCPTASDDDDSAGDDDDASNFCEAGFEVLSGTITQDTTLTADCDWLVRGGVFVGDEDSQTILTIEAGTTIYGESSTDGMLVIRRNSRILAEGTAAEPIVFTSSKNVGERARGDWGGLILNGNAPINACAEGDDTLCEAYGEGGTGWYGGDDPDDDSGVLRYVRIEFAGTLISPDNELNGLGLQGVGAGTEIDYLQIHMNADDGIEFFGGTAQAKHLVITGAGDDNLDWTDGWTGKLQFLVAQQWDGAGDNGIEADNNGDNNDQTPRSMPTISNVTLIGAGGDASDLGLLLREGTAGDLSNVVVTNWGEACLDVDHAATWTELNAGTLQLTNSILDCTTPYKDDEEPAADLEAWFTGAAGNELGDPGLGDATNTAAPDFAPAAASLAATGGSAPADGFFDAVTFRGAVGPDADWTAGWTAFPAN